MKTVATQNIFRECLKDIIFFIFSKQEEKVLLSDEITSGSIQNIASPKQINMKNKEFLPSVPLEKRSSVQVPNSSINPMTRNRIMTFSFERGNSNLGSDVYLEDFNHHLSNFMNNLIKHLVDEVCIYSEKINYLEECFKDMNFDNGEEKQRKLTIEKGHIPTRSVENDEDKNEFKYKKIIPVFLKNEENYENGKYGWLFIYLP